MYCQPKLFARYNLKKIASYLTSASIGISICSSKNLNNSGLM